MSFSITAFKKELLRAFSFLEVFAHPSIPAVAFVEEGVDGGVDNLFDVTG